LIQERKGRWTHSAYIQEIEREVTYLGGRFENLINSFENSSCTRLESQELQYNAMNFIFINLRNHRFTD